MEFRQKKKKEEGDNYCIYIIFMLQDFGGHIYIFVRYNHGLKYLNTFWIELLLVTSRDRTGSFATSDNLNKNFIVNNNVG